MFSANMHHMSTTLDTSHLERSLLSDISSSGTCQFSKWDVSSVIAMCWMFSANMQHMSTTLDTSHFERSLLNDVSSSGTCQFSKWDVSSVIAMR
jgi:hypothetical protein